MLVNCKEWWVDQRRRVQVISKIPAGFYFIIHRPPLFLLNKRDFFKLFQKEKRAIQAELQEKWCDGQLMLVWSWTQSKTTRKKVFPASDNHDSVFLTGSLYIIYFVCSRKKENQKEDPENYNMYVHLIWWHVFFTRENGAEGWKYHCLCIYMDFLRREKSAVEEEGFKGKNGHYEKCSQTTRANLMAIFPHLILSREYIQHTHTVMWILWDWNWWTMLSFFSISSCIWVEPPFIHSIVRRVHYDEKR